MSISAESLPATPQRSKSARSAKAKEPPPRVPPFHTNTPEDNPVYHDHHCAAAQQIHDPQEGSDVRPLCGLCAHYGYGRYTGWVDTYGKKATDLPANRQTLDGYLARKAELEKQADDPAAKKELAELTAAIEALEPKVDREQRISDRAQHFNDAYKAAIDAGKASGHSTDEVELLADVIMNEAHDKTIGHLARQVLAYAWINRKGGIKQPIYKKGKKGKRDLSHWDQRERRFGKLDKEFEREWYLDSLTDSLKAVTERLSDKLADTDDPAHGATHWYSPDNQPADTPAEERWWENKKEFEEVTIPGVPTGQFRFYKKKKPAPTPPKPH